jgi:hypothetical protein
MKTRYKVLIALAVVVGLLGAAAMVTLIVLSIDEPPPDDSDLLVKRENIPDEENAYWYFAKIGGVLDLPEETAEVVDKEVTGDEKLAGAALMDAILEGKAWDAAFIEDLWQRNREAVHLLEQGLSCSTGQAPSMRFGWGIPEVCDWLWVARLLNLHAILLLKQGREGEAFDEAMRVVQFGHAIEGARGALVHYLVGKVLKQEGIGRMRIMLSEAALEPDVLTSYSRRLGEYGANEPGGADALRVEYTTRADLLEVLKAGKMSLEGVHMGYMIEETGDGPRPSLPERVGFLWHFRLNRTKRMFAERFRALIGDIPTPYAQIERLTRPGNLPHPLHPLLPSNTAGKLVFLSLMPVLDSFLLAKCEENVDVGATRVLLAIKAFKVEKGRLPESLDALVPDYLDAVPLDDFDGQPLRYNAEKKVIYSVGKDLKDDGGMTKEEQKAWWKEKNPVCEEDVEPEIWQLPDPSFPIEF